MNNRPFDFLIVGAGLFGATCARLLTDAGYKVLVIEKKNHVGGNVFTLRKNDIDIHVYGAHIFHTSNKKVWNFVNRFGKFNNFINSPLANYKGEFFNLPFNMNTFVQLWPDVKTKEDALNHIKADQEGTTDQSFITNLEQQAIALVGKTIYKKLIKDYTEKQWNKKCSDLPAFIIKRIPLRFTFDNNYFNDIYQGIPIEGYTDLIGKMLSGIEVILDADYLKRRDEFGKIATRIIYTGPIDEYFGYSLGVLEYRSLRFVEKELRIDSFQGNAVINYTSHDVPYTRIIEHKFFNFKNQKGTIISEEYPEDWSIGKERFYTVNDEKNNELYAKYFQLAKNEKMIYFGGRLGMYKYFDMDDTVEAAFNLVDKILEELKK